MRAALGPIAKGRERVERVFPPDALRRATSGAGDTAPPTQRLLIGLPFWAPAARARTTRSADRRAPPDSTSGWSTRRDSRLNSIALERVRRAALLGMGGAREASPWRVPSARRSQTSHHKRLDLSHSEGIVTLRDLELSGRFRDGRGAASAVGSRTVLVAGAERGAQLASALALPHDAVMGAQERERGGAGVGASPRGSPRGPQGLARRECGTRRRCPARSRAEPSTHPDREPSARRRRRGQTTPVSSALATPRPLRTMKPRVAPRPRSVDERR